jgi:hypothetical protein
MAAALLLAGMLSLQGTAGGTGILPVDHKVHRLEACATITAYCLAGKETTSGKRVYPGCLALSRPLARRLGLKSGRGAYDYRFGTRIVVEGVGCFTFDDLMPPQWRHPRVDIHRPTVRQAVAFGLKRARVYVVERRG